MVRYVFETPVALKGAKVADAQVLGEALEQVAASKAGRLLPGDVVEAARDPKSVLHAHFEWNDASAAEAFRLVQARGLIRIIHVEDDRYEEAPRAFLSVVDADGKSYRGLAEVAENTDLQKSLLEAAARDLEGFQRRYRSLKEVCDLVEPAKSAVRKRMAAEQRAA